MTQKKDCVSGLGRQQKGMDRFLLFTAATTGAPGSRAQGVTAVSVWRVAALTRAE